MLTGVLHQRLGPSAEAVRESLRYRKHFQATSATLRAGRSVSCPFDPSPDPLRVALAEKKLISLGVRQQGSRRWGGHSSRAMARPFLQRLARLQGTAARTSFLCLHNRGQTHGRLPGDRPRLPHCVPFHEESNTNGRVSTAPSVQQKSRRVLRHLYVASVREGSSLFEKNGRGFSPLRSLSADPCRPAHQPSIFQRTLQAVQDRRRLRRFAEMAVFFHSSASVARSCLTSEGKVRKPMTGETRVIRVDLESKRGAETTRRLLEKLNGLRTPKKRFRGLSHEEKREPRHSSEGGLRKRGDSPDTRGTSCAVIANTDEGEATNQRAPSVFSRRSLRLRPAGDDTSPRLRKPSVCMEGATTTGAGIVPPVARNGSISNLLNEEDCTMDAHLEDGQSSPSPRCLSRNLGSYTPVESGSPESKTEGVVAVSRSTVCCGKSSPLLHGRPSFTLGKTVHPVLTKNDTQVEYEEGRETSGARPSLRVCLGAGVPDGPNSGYTAAEKDPLWETAAALQERKKQECEGGTRDVTAGALLREDHQVSSLLRKEDTKSSERGQAGEEESVEQPRQHTDVEHPTVEKHPDGAGPQLEQQSYEEEVELEEDEEEELVLREVAQSFKRSLRQLLVPLHEPKSSSPRTASCESPQSTSLFPSSPSSGGSSSSSVLRRPLSGLRDDVDDCDEEEPLLSSGRQPHRLQSLLERSSFPLLFAFICQAQQLHAQGLLRVLRATQSRRLSSAVAPVTPRALRPGERRLLRLKRELEEQQLRLKSEDTERDIEREGRHRENRFDRERLLRPFLSFHVYPLFAEQLEDVLLEIVKKFTLVDVQLFLAACCTQARLCTLRRRLCSSDVSTARHGLKQAHHSPATSGRVDSGTSTSESLPCSNTSSALQQPLNPHFLPRVKHARSSCPPVASSPLPSSSQSSSSCLSPLGCRGTVPSLASPANPGVWLLDTLLSASVLGSLSSVTRRRLYELNRERARHRKSLELTLQAVLSASGRRAGEHYRTYREGSSTPGKADEAQRSPEKEPMSTPPNTVPAEEETRWARPWHGTERDREGVADSVPKRVESHGTCLGSSFVPAALSSNDADSDPVGRSSLSSRWIQPSYSPFGMEVPDYLFHQQQLRVDQQWRQEWRRDLKTVERLFVLFSSLSGLLGDASASSCLLPTRNGNSGIPSPARLRTDLDETAGADEAAGAHALPVPLHSSSPSVWRSPLCGAEEELIPGENRDPGRPHRSEGRSGRSGVRHAWAPSRMGPGLASTAVPDFSKLLRTFLRVLLGLLQTPLSITHTGESLASPGPIAPAAFEWCGESPRCASATACGAKADACAVRSDPIAARRPRSLVFSSCLAHPSSLARLVLACTSPVVLSRTEGGASSTESQQGENGCPRNSSLDVLIADVYRALQVQLAEQPAKLSTGDLVDLMERLEVLVDAPRPTSSAVAPKIASEVVCMEGLSTHPECPLRPSPPPRPLLTCSQSSVSSTSDLPSDNAGAAGSSSPENSSLLSGWAVPHRSPLLSSATGTAQWCSPSGAGEGCTQSVDAWPKESNRCKKAGNEGNTMRTREFSRELEAMLDFLFFEVLPSRVDTLPVHLNQRCVRIAKTLQTKLCSQRTAPSDPAEERVATTWVARAEILERLLSKFLRSAGQNSPRRAVASSDQPPGTHGSVPFQADIDPEQFGRRKAGEDSRRALADESQDGRGMPEGGRRVSQDPYLVEQRGNEMGREEKENWEEKTISQGGRGRCLPEKMRSGCEETSTEGVEKEVAGRVGPVSKKKQKAGRLPFDHLLPFSVAAGSSSMELGGSKAGPLVHWSERLLGSPVTYLSLITGSDVFSQPLERRQARGTVRAADVLLRCRRYKKRVQRPLDILCGLSKLLNKLGQQRQEKREMVRRLMALTRDDYLPAFSSQAKGTAALMPDGRLLAPRDFPPGWKEDARFPLTDYEREQSFFSCLQVPGLGERAQPPPPPLSLPQRDLLLHLQWKQLMQRNLLVKYPLVTGRQISISDEKGRNDCPPDISSASTLLQRTEEERGRAQPERRKEWHGTTPPRSAEEKSARTGRLIEARRGEYGGVEGQSRVSRARDPRALRHYQGMNFEALVRETPYVGPPNVVQELQRLIFLPPERWKSNMASLSTLRLLQVLKVCAYQYDGLVSFLAKHRKQLVLPMVAQEEMSCGDRRELHPALVNASKARERHPLETTLVSTAGKSDVLLSCYPTGPSGGADGVYRAVLAQATSPWGRLEAFLTCLLDILLSQLQRKYSSEGNGLFPRIASSLVEETGEQGGGLRGPGSRRRGLPQSVQGEDGLEPKALHSARDSRHLRALKLRTSREVSLGASILRALAVLQQHYQRFGRGWMPKKEEENDRSDQEAPEREQAETAREEIARVLGNQGSLDEARGTEHGTRTDKRDKQEDPGRRLEMEKLQMKEKENPVGRSEGTKVMFEAAVHHCAEQVLELLLQTHRLWKLSLLQFVRVVYATEVLFLPRKDSAASLSYSSSSEMHSLSLTNSSAWSSPPGTSMASSERGGKAETTKEEVLKPIRPQVDSAHAQPLHFSLSVQRHLSALAMATQTLLRPPSASGVKGDPTGCSWIPGFPAVSLRERALSSEHRRGTGRSEATRLPTTLDGRSCPEVVGNRRTLEKRADEREAGTMRERKRARRTESSDASSQYSRVAPLPAASIAPLTRSFAAVYRHVYLSVRRQRAQGDSTEETKPRRSHQRADQQRSGGVSQTAPSASDRSLGTAAPTEQLELSGSRLNLTNTEEEKIDIHTNSLDDEEALLEEYEKVLLRLAAEAVCLCGSLAEKHWRATVRALLCAVSSVSFLPLFFLALPLPTKRMCGGATSSSACHVDGCRPGNSLSCSKDSLGDTTANPSDRALSVATDLRLLLGYLRRCPHSYSSASSLPPARTALASTSALHSASSTSPSSFPTVCRSPSSRSSKSSSSLLAASLLLRQAVMHEEERRRCVVRRALRPDPQACSPLSSLSVSLSAAPPHSISSPPPAIAGAAEEKEQAEPQTGRMKRTSPSSSETSRVGKNPTLDSVQESQCLANAEEESQGTTTSLGEGRWGRKKKKRRLDPAHRIRESLGSAAMSGEVSGQTEELNEEEMAAQLIRRLLLALVRANHDAREAGTDLGAVRTGKLSGEEGACLLGNEGGASDRGGAACEAKSRESDTGVKLYQQTLRLLVEARETDTLLGKALTALLERSPEASFEECCQCFPRDPGSTTAGGGASGQVFSWSPGS